MKRMIVVMSAVLLLVSAMTYEGHAAVVDLELVLMADVSGSVDAADFDLQKTGYVQAFQNAGLISAIQDGGIGAIAVTLVYWSDSATVAVPWMLVNDAASGNAFATAVNTAARSSSGGTGMTNALSYSSTLFASNGFEGTRNVIDVSGDGAESNACSFNDPTCTALQLARDAFLNAGSGNTINALWIDDRDFFGDDAADAINALLYGTTNVIGGPNAFQDIVQDFPEFSAAIQAKLIREVTEVPEPGTMMLLGSGLVGLAGFGRKRFTK